MALPFVNSALAGRAPFKDSVNALRSEGVRILLGPGEFVPTHLDQEGTGSLTSPGNWPLHQSRISSHAAAL